MALSGPVPAAPRDALAPLFVSHDRLRAVIEAVLEGAQGRAWTDGLERPEVARLDLGVYRIFGGAAGAALPLLSELAAPAELVVDGSPAWEARIAALGDRVSRRAMRSFAGVAREGSKLRLLCQPPAGFRIEPIDAGLAARIGPELAPNRIAVFGTPARFAQAGLGFCALSGEVVACAATSYALSSRRCEIAIATRPEMRRRGLALALAARMVLGCLERGLEPHWNAANEVSAGIAERVGLAAIGDCAVYDLAHA